MIPSRPRVLLVAPHNSYRIGAYLEAAAQLRLDVVVASTGEHSLVAAIADGVRIDLADSVASAATLLADPRVQGVDAVIATDDAAVELAGRVAEELGISHNPAGALRIAGRKDLQRAALGGAGLPVPAFRTVTLAEPIGPQVAGLALPCVVKPVALSASRGVIRCDTGEELVAACARIATILRHEPAGPQRQLLLVEDYVPGREIAVEAMLRDGTLHMLAMFDKPDPLEGPYFEETYYIAPSSLDARRQAMVIEILQRGCAAIGLRQGPVHAELRIDGDAIRIVEIAARTIGGECARLLQLGAGRSLEALVLEEALGAQPEVECIDGGAGVLMIPIPRSGVLRRVEGVMDAMRVAGVEDVRLSLREGSTVRALPDGASYLGFIFARAHSAAAAERALREAHACLNVVIEPLFEIEAGGPAGD